MDKRKEMIYTNFFITSYQWIEYWLIHNQSTATLKIKTAFLFRNEMFQMFLQSKALFIENVKSFEMSFVKFYLTKIWGLLWNFLNFLWFRSLCFESRWLSRMVFIIFNTLATFRIYLTSFISTLDLKNPSLSGCKMWLQPSETSSGTSKQPLGQGMLGALWMSLVSLNLNITSCIVFCMHGFFSHVGIVFCMHGFFSHVGNNQV